MARSSISTLLPLDSWAKIMGVNPWEFNQIGEGFPVPNTAQCEHVFFQYQWQQDFLSRDEIAQAIQSAETMIADYLGFWPAPKYLVDEVHGYPRTGIRDTWGNGGTARGQYKALQAHWGKIQGGGIMARSTVDLAGAVVLSDTNGDGIDDKFTVTVATSVTDVSEIAIYFKSSDRNGDDVDETWRIRPVKVSISGGNAVITGHPSLLVIPDLATKTDAEVLDVTASIYVSEVEVYRVYRDTTATTTTMNQGSAMWENTPGGCDTPDCAVQYVPICLGFRNAYTGLVYTDYMLDGVCPPYAREPDRVSMNYLAGEPLVNGQMNPDLADAVAKLATSLLPVDKCGCERSNRIISWWRSMVNQGEEQRPITTEEINNNPFGEARRGTLFAWHKLEPLQQVWGSLV